MTRLCDPAELGDPTWHQICATVGLERCGRLTEEAGGGGSRRRALVLYSLPVWSSNFIGISGEIGDCKWIERIVSSRGSRVGNSGVEEWTSGDCPFSGCGPILCSVLWT